MPMRSDWPVCGSSVSSRGGFDQRDGLGQRAAVAAEDG
jgi:hypothetical protein